MSRANAMRQPDSSRPRLRKREIVFAVAAGAVAAGGAALLLSDDIGPGPGTMPGFAGPGDRIYEVAEFDEISTTGPQDIVILAMKARRRARRSSTRRGSSSRPAS